MNKIHDSSKITPHPDLNIFEIPPTQSSIEKTIVTEHRPISILTSNTMMEFNVPTAIDEYNLLRDMQIHLQIQVNIQKAAGGNVVEADWKKLSPVNNLLHSLFKVVDIEIDGKSITLSPQTYAYKAFFETVLGYTYDSKVSFLTGSAFYLDDENKNTSPEKRSKFIRPNPITSDGRGKIVDLMGKIHFDLALQPKALLGGTKLKIILIPNKPSFYLWAHDSTITPSVDFISATLYCTRVKVAQPILEAHNSVLMKSTAKYPISRGNVKSFTVNAGVLDVNLDNAITGRIPRRMFIALVTHKSFNGDILENPYNFKHFNLNYLTASIDGTQYPSIPYAPDFSKGLYIREYMGLFDALNMLNTDAALTMNRDDYANGNTIYGFNFSQDTTDDCNKVGYVNYQKNGAIRIQMRFASALADAINVVIYCEYDNLIQIDINRKVLTDYI